MKGWERSVKRKKQKAKVGTDGGWVGEAEVLGGRLSRGRWKNGMELTRGRGVVQEGESSGGSLSTG